MTSEKPPMEKSGEAKPEQLDLAREQGRAYEHALMEMTQKEAHGQQKQVDEYLVGVAVEHAEGTWQRVDGDLEWKLPDRENAHLEVAVRDAADGRFIPGLHVELTVEDEQGKEIGTHEQPFLWHPWLYHYGRNWEIPDSGTYTLRVHVDAPEFGRHDSKNGKRYAKPVDVTFEGISIETGQKRTTPSG
ncbi:MAG: iron transporter [Dehalococcoidia bacterium]|nr:iron transporter [Dehalococcoidia bacterium]